MATVVAADIITLGRGSGKLHSKLVDPTRAPKVTKTRTAAAQHTAAAPKECNPVPPAKKAPALPEDSAKNAPTTQEARATWIHDRYGESVVGGPLTAKTFELVPGSKLDARIADHYNAQTGTLYEFNTTPWNTGVPDLKAKVDFKIAQVSKDFQLRAEGTVQNVVWCGTEPLPTTGEGGRLRQALINANIRYRVVPLPPTCSGCGRRSTDRPSRTRRAVHRLGRRRAKRTRGMHCHLSYCYGSSANPARPHRSSSRPTAS
ncbi:hypothetical protein [Mycolicibacterium arenosum]|uniref:Uncharacterized protein n=1 Tax=Mycolicibacterium arenosum TaxID=2952157 RepID=A0ABT1M4C0_9MYCO|nr:hypothetical protein [Mycolicibacterium sp. CAU 1645]MCP9274013.1 hypothetical protein [Mycolicibacterium sp. CAU 1645]